MMRHTQQGPYRIVYDPVVTAGDLEVLSKALGETDCGIGEGLVGRGRMARATLDDSQPVIIKPYCRGGIVRYFIKRHYLRWGKRRCHAEYDMLRRVNEIGVNAPEPVAYAFQGTLFYKSWLITREIDRPERLSDVSHREETDVRGVLESLADQVALLIEHRIRHVDLHPGNVLVDGSRRVFIVDFDKARTFRGGKTRLRDRYISRWSRAVKKYDLPKALDTEFRNRLERLS